MQEKHSLMERKEILLSILFLVIIPAVIGSIITTVFLYLVDK